MLALTFLGNNSALLCSAPIPRSYLALSPTLATRGLCGQGMPWHAIPRGQVGSSVDEQMLGRIENDSFPQAVRLLRADVVSACNSLGVPLNEMWPEEAILLNMVHIRRCCEEALGVHIGADYTPLDDLARCVSATPVAFGQDERGERLPYEAAKKRTEGGGEESFLDTFHNVFQRYRRLSGGGYGSRSGRGGRDAEDTDEMEKDEREAFIDAAASVVNEDDDWQILDL